MSRTPTPWRVSRTSHPEYLPIHTTIVDDEGRRVAEAAGRAWPRKSTSIWMTPEPEAEANAEFIVRAVNNHEALVEAARYALEYIEADRDFDEEPLEPGTHMQDNVIADLREAIQKASG